MGLKSFYYEVFPDHRGSLRTDVHSINKLSLNDTVSVGSGKMEELEEDHGEGASGLQVRLYESELGFV